MKPVREALAKWGLAPRDMIAVLTVLWAIPNHTDENLPVTPEPAMPTTPI